MAKFSLTRYLTAGALLFALGATPVLAHESAGQYLDDSVVTTRVKAAFAGDPQVKAHQINVKTYDGVVQLNGFVDSPQQIAKAAQDAREVPGVKKVENNLSAKR
jgi:hyperosmotically inducible protein